MAILLDGNNLLGRLGGGSREALLAELAELARRKRKALTVVFDGPPPRGGAKVQSLGSLTVVYAAPRSADEEIVRRVQETRDPRGQTVVTDDRGLVSAVSGAGAKAQGLEAFRRDASQRLSGVAEAVERREPAQQVSAKEWERWFSDPKNRLGR